MKSANNEGEDIEEVKDDDVYKRTAIDSNSEHSQEVIEPSQKNIEPSQKNRELSLGVREPSQGVLEPSLKVLEPSQEVLEPSQEVIEPSQKVLEPLLQVLKPSQEVLEPSQKVLEPSQEVLQPSKEVLEPSQEVLKPSLKVLEPSQEVHEPSHGVLEPSQEVLEPSLKVLEPSKKGFVDALSMEQSMRGPYADYYRLLRTDDNHNDGGAATYWGLGTFNAFFSNANRYPSPSEPNDVSYYSDFSKDFKSKWSSESPTDLRTVERRKSSKFDLSPVALKPSSAAKQNVIPNLDVQFQHSHRNEKVNIKRFSTENNVDRYHEDQLEIHRLPKNKLRSINDSGDGDVQSDSQKPHRLRRESDADELPKRREHRRNSNRKRNGRKKKGVKGVKGIFGEYT
ncbi:hypothetical protein HAZT_HAZT000013 [Hyalella azteca]|uniref:Uncharacterized protein n=1 Tax=Hyalella azteca TaxID=294128 RepID=A0A6A0H9T9_HYAAZ|nr:hypothetical protein HAZT_HAZT000013 [Hyalella azteca]